MPLTQVYVVSLLPRSKYGIRLPHSKYGIRLLPTADFNKQFPRPGRNFETRLQQLKHFFPDATDWTMEEVDL